MSEASGLRTVRAENPSPMTLDGTRTFVLGARRPVVIDPGPDDARHRDAILARLGGATPVAILLTHAHPDHAAGAPALADRTGAPIWLAEAGVQGARAPAWVDHRVADGDEVVGDAGAVQAVATPGHTPDHMAYLWRAAEDAGGGALFVGDLLMGAGDTTLVAPPEGDLAAYLRSLDRVEALGCSVLYPTHGPPLQDPAEAVQRYRRHRMERIRQVAEARGRYPDAAPDELVRAVYGSDLHPDLQRAAEGSLRAILRYLGAAAN